MEKLNNYDYVAANIYFSGACNLQCTYCFQPKICGHMGSVNEKIINWISSGKMEDDILKYIGDKTQIFSLWGGEPSINLPFLEKRLTNIFEKFPELNEIFYSTNLSTRKLTENTLNFILECKKNAIKFNRVGKFRNNIQISLDGTPEVNDKNRIGSSAEKICNNVTFLLTELSKNNITCDDVSFHFKGTQGSDSLKYLTEGNHLYEHFKYFDDWYSVWDKICNYYPAGGEFITLVYPGQYTQEDGFNLTKITKVLLSEEFRNNNWKHKLLFETQFTRRVIQSINDTLKANGRSFKGEWLINSVCSAGRSCAGITYDGMYHWCQATYFFDKETRKYIEDNNLVTDFEANQGFSFRNFETFVDKVESAKYENDELNLSRSLEIPAIYRLTPEMRISYLNTIISELADVGQISKCFNEKVWKDLAINYLIFGGNECIADNVWEFGSIWARNVSALKLLFNGSFELIVNNYKEKLK